MTTLREAAQQALEALEAIREADTAGATPKMVVEARKMYEPTITALRAALAEKALHIDTLRMALEAGFAVEDGGVYTPDAYGPGDVTQLVKRFAALVAAAEQEACAKTVEIFDKTFQTGGGIAGSIRARSNT